MVKAKKPNPAPNALRETWNSADDLAARAGSLATINAIADTVYRYLDIKSLAEHAVAVILEYIPVSSVALFTLEDNSEWLHIEAWRGFTEETLRRGSRLPVKASLTGITVTRKDIVTDYEMAQSESLEPAVKQALLKQGLTGVISVPLLFQEQSVGAVNLIFHETHKLTPLERETLLSIGKTIGLALVNAQHVTRIEAEIQQRRKAEEALRRYQEHLEDLVKARTAELEATNAQLRDTIADLEAAEKALRESNVQLEVARQRTEQISEAKNIFLSNMSHELRTPLNVIIGYSSSMLDLSAIYDHVVLPDIYRKDVQLLLDNAQYLLGLINDVLDLSKIEAGKLELHRSAIHLAEIFKSALAIAVGLVKEKPIQVRADYPDALPAVWADAMRVRQILLNLLSNALKFTKMGSVTVQAQVEGDFLRIAVTDTGIGIPAKALPYIFDRFQQAAHDTNRTYGGTGLGLDISKQLTAMHGGEMSVTSTEGEGSTFAFTLPIASTIASGQPATMPNQPDGLHGAIRRFEPNLAPDLADVFTVLVVENEISTRNLLQATLEGAGYIFLDTGDSAHALTIAQNILPDLIILGNAEDGYLLDALRQQPDTAPIPVVVCKSHTHEVALSGAAAMLEKPIDPNHLLTTLSGLLIAR